MCSKIHQKAIFSCVLSLMTWDSIHAVNCFPCYSCYDTDWSLPRPAISWGSAEYLLWELQSSPATVPLVATAPVIPSNGSQLLGQPDTTILLGDKKSSNGYRSGGRFTLGYWFDRQEYIGGEISYFFLQDREKVRSISSSGQIGSPFLAFPYFNAATDTESFSRLALPGVFSGKAKLKIRNSLQGGEVNCVVKLDPDFFGLYNCYDVNMLVGFRYMNFEEDLTFCTNSPFINPPIDVFKTKDSFSAQNNFYGFQIGIDGKFYWRQFFVRGSAKLGLGSMREKLSIKGKLSTNDFNGFGSVQKFPAGYLAMATNKGNHKQTRFAYIPEFNLSMGYQVSDMITMEVGYTFLYVSDVIWATNQIDRQINPSQAPAISNTPSIVAEGTKKPKALLKTASLWMQGLTAGFEFFF